jgi:heme A synthase
LAALQRPATPAWWTAGRRSLLLTAVAIRFERGRGAFFWTSIAAIVIYVAQALLGAANVWLGLATGIRIAHLATAQALWMAAAALTALAANARHGAPAPSSEAIERHRLPATPAPDRRPRFGDRVRSDAPPAEGGQP